MRVAFLLDDAGLNRPRRGDLESKREVERATDALIKHYQEAKRQGRMRDLDIRVKFFCDDLQIRNGGKLPTPKGGRPDKEHEHFQIAFWINERVEALGGKRGSVRVAMRLRDIWGIFQRMEESGSERAKCLEELAQFNIPTKREKENLEEKAARLLRLKLKPVKGVGRPNHGGKVHLVG